MPRLRVLFATAELSPYSKVGGLADVAEALPKALVALGHDVRVVTPAHGGVDLSEARTATSPLQVELYGQTEAADFAVLPHETGSYPVYFLVTPRFRERPEVYGAPDDLLRYLLFSKAVLELPKLLGWAPHVLHLNDWHTAPMAFALRNRAWSDPFYRATISLYTIHNLRYRGPDEQTDFACQALQHADLIVTVSPTYAEEIQTPEFGEGLDALLRLRRDDLFGILNGIDTELFDPANDPDIFQSFDVGALDRRVENKRGLLGAVGLPDDASLPLVGMVSRVTEQKGFDILLGAHEGLFRETPALAVILGAGDEALCAGLRAAEAAHPGRLAVRIGFDPALGQKIYAGSDMFLMPSRFEPCGLGQLIAMRYGSVPVARRTGGLADTVVDADEQPEAGTGFLFGPYEPAAILDALGRALACYGDVARWRAIQERGMRSDFSWAASAGRYAEVYLLGLRRRGIDAGEPATEGR